MTADKNHNSFIHDLQVATPCKANWNEMTGDEQKRMCGMCHMNVYNLSSMTLEEAEALVLNAEGRTCIRMYRRADGTVITKDCPVGIAARVKLGMKKTFAIASGVAAIIIAWAINARPEGGLTVWEQIAAKLNMGVGCTTGGGRAMMGEMVAPASVEMGKMKAPTSAVNIKTGQQLGAPEMPLIRLHEPDSKPAVRRAPLPTPVSPYSAENAPENREVFRQVMKPSSPTQTPRGYIKIDNQE
jgi:hypothetical protein